MNLPSLDTPLKSGLTASLSITYPDWRTALPDLEHQIPPLLSALTARLSRIQNQGQPNGDVCLVFTNDTTIRGLNHQYRNRNKATNVLSFPALSDPLSLQNPAPIAPTNDPLPDATLYPKNNEQDLMFIQVQDTDILYGDVVISFETMAHEAEAAGKSLYDHTLHLVTHGILHVLGFDHDTDTKAQQMEQIETYVLADLGLADPYA